MSEKFLDTLKEIWHFVSSFISGAFVLFAYFSTIVITEQLIKEYWNFHGTGIIAWVLVSALTYLAYKRFNE